MSKEKTCVYVIFHEIEHDIITKMAKMGGRTHLLLQRGCDVFLSKQDALDHIQRQDSLWQATRALYEAWLPVNLDESVVKTTLGLHVRLNDSAEIGDKVWPETK